MRNMRKNIKSLYLIALHGLVALMLVKTDFAVRIGRKAGIVPPPAIKPDVEFLRKMDGIYRIMDASVPDGATVFIGDSITQGLCTSAVTPLAVNFGIGWDTTGGVASRITNYQSFERASAIVLAIGINDLMGEDRDANAVTNFARILSSIPAKTPVLVSGVLPVDDSLRPPAWNQNNRRIERFNAQIRIVCGARPGCLFMDAGNAMKDGVGLKQSLHSGDGLHLNPSGYAVWISELRDGLEKLKPK